MFISHVTGPDMSIDVAWDFLKQSNPEWAQPTLEDWGLEPPKQITPKKRLFQRKKTSRTPVKERPVWQFNQEPPIFDFGPHAINHVDDEALKNIQEYENDETGKTLHDVWRRAERGVPKQVWLQLDKLLEGKNQNTRLLDYISPKDMKLTETIRHSPSASLSQMIHKSMIFSFLLTEKEINDITGNNVTFLHDPQNKLNKIASTINSKFLALSHNLNVPPLILSLYLHDMARPAEKYMDDDELPKYITHGYEVGPLNSELKTSEINKWLQNIASGIIDDDNYIDLTHSIREYIQSPAFNEEVSRIFDDDIHGDNSLGQNLIRNYQDTLERRNSKQMREGTTTRRPSADIYNEAVKITKTKLNGLADFIINADKWYRNGVINNPHINNQSEGVSWKDIDGPIHSGGKHGEPIITTRKNVTLPHSENMMDYYTSLKWFKKEFGWDNLNSDIKWNSVGDGYKSMEPSEIYHKLVKETFPTSNYVLFAPYDKIIDYLQDSTGYTFPKSVQKMIKEGWGIETDWNDYAPRHARKLQDIQQAHDTHDMVPIQHTDMVGPFINMTNTNKWVKREGIGQLMNSAILNRTGHLLSDMRTPSGQAFTDSLEQLINMFGESDIYDKFGYPYHKTKEDRLSGIKNFLMQPFGAKKLQSMFGVVPEWVKHISRGGGANTYSTFLPSDLGEKEKEKFMSKVEFKDLPEDWQYTLKNVDPEDFRDDPELVSILTKLKEEEMFDWDNDWEKITPASRVILTNALQEEDLHGRRERYLHYQLPSPWGELRPQSDVLPPLQVKDAPDVLIGDRPTPYFTDDTRITPDRTRNLQRLQNLLSSRLEDLGERGLRGRQQAVKTLQGAPTDVLLENLKWPGDYDRLFTGKPRIRSLKNLKDKLNPSGVPAEYYDRLRSWQDEWKGEHSTSPYSYLTGEFDAGRSSPRRDTFRPYRGQTTLFPKFVSDSERVLSGPPQRQGLPTWQEVKERNKNIQQMKNMYQQMVERYEPNFNPQEMQEMFPPPFELDLTSYQMLQDRAPYQHVNPINWSIPNNEVN